VLAGLDYISGTIGFRRLEHATETLTDAAEEFGADTAEDWLEASPCNARRPPLTRIATSRCRCRASNRNQAVPAEI
jgi:hypothetical protein